MTGTRAFSGKVDTGFSQKMRPNKESRARYRFNLIGTRSRVAATAVVIATALASVAFAQQPKATATAPAGDTQPTLLGQYGDWGAYAASPGGAKVCFALAKPKTTKTEPPGRKRDPSYIFVSTRPAENVKHEVSVIIGYPFKTNSDATAEIGTTKLGMYTP